MAGLSGWDLKRIMRTGTVATIDNRNWELRDHVELVERFAQSRAIALDMESATIAANGFSACPTAPCCACRTSRCELKLPGMASAFYRRQVNQHLEIGIRALERLRGMPPERLHSRKLRTSWKPPSNSRHGASHIFLSPLIHQQWGQGIGFLLQVLSRQDYPDRIRAAAPTWHGLPKRGHASRLCRSAVAPLRRASARGGFHLTRSRLCRSAVAPLRGRASARGGFHSRGAGFAGPQWRP